MPTIEVIVNGTPRSIADDATVAGLLRSLDLGRSPCAVEVNRDVVPKKQHADHQLQSGDLVEIVTLVGGG